MSITPQDMERTDEAPGTSLLLERARIGAWILFVFSVYLPVGDLIAGTEAPPLLWITHTLRLLWFSVIILALRLPNAAKYAKAYALLMASSILVTACLASLARDAVATMLMVATAVPLATCSLFPWGTAAQCMIVLFSAVIVAGLPGLVMENVENIFPTNTAFNLAGVWGLSIYLAHAYDGNRRAIEVWKEALENMNATLEQRIEQRTAKLDQTNKDLASFAYSISHDLRTPLRTIDGFSQLVLDETAERLEETERGHLTTVRTAAQHMGALIDALLGLSRIGRQELRRERLDLSAIARSVLADLGREEAGRDISVDIKQTPPVYGDPTLLRDVMQNLLHNAWKYSAKTQAPLIEFSAAKERGETVYRIRDNGVGFDMDSAGKLFDPFERLHPPSEFEGTGIGLATVRRIIQLHGGRVWAEGSAGHGATFRFTVPGAPFPER